MYYVFFKVSGGRHFPQKNYWRLFASASISILILWQNPSKQFYSRKIGKWPQIINCFLVFFLCFVGTWPIWPANKMACSMHLMPRVRTLLTI